MLLIRQEKKSEHRETVEVIRKAFEKEEYSDKTEHVLVQNLRRCSAFVPELSIVAVAKKRIVGHILFTRISIGVNESSDEWLALAPVSVLPEVQNQGIGGLLIEYGHKRAIDLGFKAIHVIGHENYYPRFGYEMASKHDISPSFEVPEANNMIIELMPGSLDGVNGEIKYAPPFGL